MGSQVEKHIATIVQRVVSEIFNEESCNLTGRRKLVVANWKMNMTQALATEFLNQLCSDGASSEVVICPPNTMLDSLNQLLKKQHLDFSLGAQNVHWAKAGAHTGEVSASMLIEVGCKYVIIGHSELRMTRETDEEINKKVKQANFIGLNPIICVGETKEQREQGYTNDIVNRQLRKALQGVEEVSHIVVAYEPVWAIGTGLSASPEQAQAVHQTIRKTLADMFGEESNKTPILYGGSVKPDNAKRLSAMEDIDGALVGGASLVADDFTAIVQSF